MFLYPSSGIPRPAFFVNYLYPLDKILSALLVSSIPPPLAVTVCVNYPLPSPYISFATITPDLFFFINLRHTLLHFKSTTPPPPPPMIQLLFSESHTRPPFTYLKNSYLSDTLLCFFYLNYPSPPGVFLYPSSGIPQPALFCVNCPSSPD